MSNFIKKHHRQFSDRELRALQELQSDLTIRKYSPHCLQRAKERGVFRLFKKIDFLETLRYGKVIEVKTNGRDTRVVYRSLFARQQEHLVVVYSLTFSEVISVWTNRQGDYHSTVDLSVYDETIDVLELVEKLKQSKYYQKHRR